MTYDQCVQTGDVCLQFWMVDSPIIIGILSFVALVFGVKMVLRLTPLIG